MIVGTEQSRSRFKAVYVLALFFVVGCAALVRFPDASDLPEFIAFRSDSDLKFSHEIHDDDCDECHPGLEPDDALEDIEDRSSLRMPTKAHCFECHAETLDCSYCHETLRPTRAPPSHTGGLLRNHGRLAAAEHARCDWCHGRTGTSCEQCHRQMAPADHGPRWKNQMHGRQAIHGRDRCWVCHQSDECARCHSQPPENHTARFRMGDHGLLAQRKLRSCFVCHQFEKTCIQCHSR